MDFQPNHLSLMAAHFESADEYIQYVEQYLIDQTAKLQGYKSYLDDGFCEAVKQAEDELRRSLQQEFDTAVLQESHRIEILKQQEARAWKRRCLNQLTNDFNVQVALNKDSLEAELRTQYDGQLAGKDELVRRKDVELSQVRSALARSESTDELVRQKDRELSGLKSALASSRSTNKDLSSRIKEQEESCAQKATTAQKKIQELEEAQAASTISLNSANNQIGQLQNQVQACQNDIQAGRQELANEVAAHATTRSNNNSISQSLTLVTNQRDHAQGQWAGHEEVAGKLRARNQGLQTDLEDAQSKNGELRSELERRSQKTESDWAEAQKYVEGLEKERDSLREEKNSLQRRVQELTVVSPEMETEEPEQSGQAAQQQQASVGPTNLASDQKSPTEEDDDEESDLDRRARRRRAREAAPAKTDAKSNRIGKKKAGKATKVVNVKAVKAKDSEIMEEFEEGNFIYGQETVKGPPEWHPFHPKFNRNIVDVKHEDFNPQALQYVTKVQFELQQEQNKAADANVEANKTAESIVDQISNMNW